ncbi:hypothetical protein PMAC_000522 [Pneumocystis sp. 'macacae']|nr:hypothetical protein PMAC_000522 [Pneumocystis sp. 'macacae']
MSELRMDVIFADTYCFAGEPLSCVITFTRTELDKHEDLESFKKDVELLAESLNESRFLGTDQSSSIFQKTGQKSMPLLENKENFQIRKTNELKKIDSISSTESTVNFVENSGNILEAKSVEEKVISISDLSVLNENILSKVSKNDELNKEISLETSLQDIDVFYNSNEKKKDFQDELRSEVHSDIPSMTFKDSFQKENKETLMIGYVQVIGYFILNEKIVKIDEFEDLKVNRDSENSIKNGLLSVHAQTNRKTRFVGQLGLFNNGLNSFLKNQFTGSLSDFKEMKNSKYIPILSVPPSILFIDLQLAPGESRSFGYKFILPSQLPPTYDGKSIKISYHLSIGTQRSGTEIQQLKISKIPFQVLSRIDETGNHIIYDLFSPITFLTDQAYTFVCKSSKDISELLNADLNTKDLDSFEDNEYSKEDFINYLSEHLHDDSLKSLLLFDDIKKDVNTCSSNASEQTKKCVIDMKSIINNITRNSSLHSNLSNKRFNINKNGNVIGVVSIPKSFYKLGETINGIVDFSSAKLPCYQIKFFLETTEIVDSSISISSKTDISQTRKIYDSCSEITLYTSRIQFKLTIPVTAPPSFKTSAISLLWAVRLEITMPLLVYKQSDQIESFETLSMTKLMNECHKDYRETLYLAPSSLECGIFDCTIPITIFPLLKSSKVSNAFNTTFYL